MEEVNAGLTSGETRTFFDERMEKFNINYDAEHDNQENKNNFEATCKEVDNLFEDVKGMVQFNWIIRREEESNRLIRSRMVYEPTSKGVDPGGQVGPGTMMYENQGIGGRTQGVVEYDGEPRTKGEQSNDQPNQQIGLWLDRPTENRKHVGLNKPTSARRKLMRDGQIYAFLYEIGNTVRTQDLRWTWNVWVSKMLDCAFKEIFSSVDPEHEMGTNLENECRESKDKIENIIKDLLKDKAMKGQLTDTARQTAYVNSLEDATRFQQRMMMTVNRQISGLRTEEEVIKSLLEQKTIQFINANTAKMIKDNSSEQDNNRLKEAIFGRLYREVCKLAMAPAR